MYTNGSCAEKVQHNFDVVLVDHFIYLPSDSLEIVGGSYAFLQIFHLV